jgi:hypothetical protein
MKLTAAQRSLISLLTFEPRRCIRRKEAVKHGMGADFDRAERAGLIVSAGYETSAIADEWLDSPAGRAALQSGNQEGEGRGEREDLVADNDTTEERSKCECCGKAVFAGVMDEDGALCCEECFGLALVDGGRGRG